MLTIVKKQEQPKHVHVLDILVMMSLTFWDVGLVALLDSHWDEVKVLAVMAAIAHLLYEPNAWRSIGPLRLVERIMVESLKYNGWCQVTIIFFYDVWEKEDDEEKRETMNSDVR